jgi:hypothetical protein
MLLSLAVGFSLGLPLQEQAAVLTAENNTFNDPNPSQCASVANTLNNVPFRDFCGYDRACWPAMYSLGVQKAATTSVSAVLERCGLAATGSPARTP